MSVDVTTQGGRNNVNTDMPKVDLLRTKQTIQDKFECRQAGKADRPQPVHTRKQQTNLYLNQLIVLLVKHRL